MYKLIKFCRFFAPGIMFLLVVGCGSTATMESHPLLANASNSDAAKVYFLRTDPGFQGVMGNAFKLSLAGQQLLTLAKGEYTLVYLKPWSGDVTVESSTVVNRGGMNTQVAVKESQSFTFADARTYYIGFRESPRGYVPYNITEDDARNLASRLKPVGMAVATPL